jgi:cbb3-type cytochrome oxidase subunit 3
MYSTALSVVFLVVLALGWILLGVVCWIFWRAKKREDSARLEAANRWPNAPSS